jgi:hypothetical protein
MMLKNIKAYLLNCFLLMVPVALWNALLTPSLPWFYSEAVFWKDIPQMISLPEQGLRVLVFALPLAMPLSIETRSQRRGLMLYAAGLMLYFLSWMAQILYPESLWSTSAFGFLAPAYITILWLAGIGLTGRKLFFNIPYHPAVYILLSVLFVIFHTLHAYLVFGRL